MQENNKMWNNIGAFHVSATSFNTMNLLWGIFIEYFPLNKMRLITPNADDDLIFHIFLHQLQSVLIRQLL